MKGVYSTEANKEAEEKMYTASNFMNINTTNTRTSKIEAMQTMYHITRWYSPAMDKK